MPTYQYACKACEHRFEQVQSFSDPSLTQCPECGGKLHKVYGSVGVVFKGSGFYRTDSRAGNKSSVAAEKPSPSSEKSAKTESKPSASSDSASKTPTPAAS